MARDEVPGEVVLVRHGETEWTLTGQHTGRTDIPLTERGRNEARLLAPLLSSADFALVLSSPLRRARETCELAGLASRVEIEPNLMEWNYGNYEGLTSKQIERTAPNWMVFTDGCPGGETPEQVGARADRVIDRIRRVSGRVVLFAHGHLLRVLAARWIGFPPSAGQHFLLNTSTICILSYYRGTPAVKRWNAPIKPPKVKSHVS
jgi:probable phosphoglycerate mutase